MREMNKAHVTTRPVDRPTLLRLAAAADADPRTVLRALHGEQVRGRAGERIARVLQSRGLQQTNAESTGPEAA